MLTTKFKSLKKLAALSAIATMCGFAKAEEKGFENIESLPNGQVLVHNTDTNGVANIGGIQTPFMFVDGDLNRGFAPAAISNATSVASDGTNCYANVDGKVMTFKLTKDGIPSMSDTNKYDMVFSNGIKSAETVNAKVVAATEDGFVGTFGNSVAKFTKNPQIGYTNYVASSKINCSDSPRLSYDDGENTFVLSDLNLIGLNKSTGTKIFSEPKNYSDVTSFAMVKRPNGNYTTIQGYQNGKINNADEVFSGAISSISISPDKQLAYATAENAANSNEYAVINAQQGYVISNAVINANIATGLKKVIDKQENMGRMIFVTRSKMGLEK